MVRNVQCGIRSRLSCLAFKAGLLVHLHRSSSNQRKVFQKCSLGFAGPFSPSCRSRCDQNSSTYGELDSAPERSQLLQIAQSVHATALHSPALDHVLISVAVRLAQSVGLHRKMQLGCDPESDDSIDRCWLFWSIYCLEKNIAFANDLDSVGSFSRP